VVTLTNDYLSHRSREREREIETNILVAVYVKTGAGTNEMNPRCALRWPIDDFPKVE